MTEGRVHRAASEDGTEIAGHVHGEGPALVLVPGGLGDGETSWRFLIPLLSDSFTCYAMSPRGRGLSAQHPDVSHERRVQDVIAFVESIDGPVTLMGHSSGGVLALEAAGQTDAISALVLYEPTLREFADEELIARGDDAVARGRLAVEDGAPAAAAQVFFEDLGLANDEELAMLAQGGVYELVAPNVPIMLEEVAQSGQPRLTDLSLLDRLAMPVLVLVGSRTHPFYADVVQEVARRLPDVDVREIEGAGHLAPQLAPERVAEELARFAGVIEARA